MKKRPVIFLVAALISFGCAMNIQATILTPGVYTPLLGTTSAANPDLAGLVVEDDVIDFSFAAYGGTVFGQVQVRVVEAIDSTYDFYWRVFNDEQSSGAIGDFRIGDFLTSSYDADFRIDGLGDIGPDQAFLFDDPYDGYVNFNFSQGLAPGQESLFFFLDTEETNYDRTLIYDLTNVGQTEISASYTGYAPAPVPEPTTMLLFGAGIAGLAAIGRRKK